MVASTRLEDYLETVFSIEISGVEPTITAIAEKLSLTKGTVVTGIKKLAGSFLLEHEPYGTVCLTEAGREQALKIYRRHETISSLFMEMLDLGEPQAEHLACIMEHEMDDKSEQRLLALGEFYFSSRRNGDEWVARLEEELHSERTLPRPLAMVIPGDPCTIVRITASGSLRMRLLEKGFVPGTPVEMVRVAPLKDPVLVRVRGADISLRRSEAASIWVRREAGKN